MNDQLKADIKELSFAAGIADTFHGRNCCAALDRVEEALTHAIEHMKRGAPEGWQLVPKDPTLEMKIVGRTTHWKAVEIYKEMIAAAPPTHKDLNGND